MRIEHLIGGVPRVNNSLYLLPDNSFLHGKVTFFSNHEGIEVFIF